MCGLDHTADVADADVCSEGTHKENFDVMEQNQFFCNGASRNKVRVPPILL
jgi:hypothetical protein